MSQSITKHAHDAEAFKHWIYPINYTLRDYQYNIVQKALFSNTLVALPTGLGKTFIAAVVIYNYFLWFPESKIVFMAPTRPLVAQQIEVSPDVIVELTGKTSAVKRKIEWKTKRIFFLTPQVLANDLETDPSLAKHISLVVVDEAHKATGNYAYTQVIQLMQAASVEFRVLATPGPDIKKVQEVVTNLAIQHIELRTEDSMDISPYTHNKSTKVVVCPLSQDILDIQKAFVEILSTFTKKLKHTKAISQTTDDSNLHSFALIEARKRFRLQRSGAESGVVEGAFAVAIHLTQCLTLLYQHGVVMFYTKMSQYIDEKTTSKARQELVQHPLTMTTMAKLSGMVSLPTFSSHPKLDRLLGFVLEHFNTFGDETTRIMIFSQFRDSVDEICALLAQHKPIVRPAVFIGQSKTKGAKGFTQKDQLAVLEKFKSGLFNVVVATCIGEEGLDIGDVDMIICFDAQASPLRMLQRIGRAGRKREGKVVILLTKGKEEESYSKAQSSYKSVQKGILDSKKLVLQPKQSMIPPDTSKPEPLKLSLVVSKDAFKTHKSKSSSSDKPAPKKRKKKSDEEIAVKKIHIHALVSTSDIDSDELMNAGLFTSAIKRPMMQSLREIRAPKPTSLFKRSPVKVLVESVGFGSSDDEVICVESELRDDAVDEELDYAEDVAETIDYQDDDDCFDELPDDFFDGIDDMSHLALPGICQQDQSVSEVVGSVFNDPIEPIPRQAAAVRIPAFEWPKADGLLILKNCDVAGDIAKFQRIWSGDADESVSHIDSNSKLDIQQASKKSLIFKLGTYAKPKSFKEPVTDLLPLPLPDPIIEPSTTLDTSTNIQYDEFDDLMLDSDFPNDLQDFEPPPRPLSSQKENRLTDSPFKCPSIPQTPARHRYQGRCIQDTPQSSVHAKPTHRQIILTQQSFSTPLRQSHSAHNPDHIIISSDQDIHHTQSLLSSSPPPKYRARNAFIHHEAELSTDDSASADEDERYLDQDLSGLIDPNTSTDTLSFYRKTHSTVTESDAKHLQFGERMYERKPKLQYMNRCSSPMMKSEEMSQAGSILDFVVNDSEGNSDIIDLTSEL